MQKNFEFQPGFVSMRTETTHNDVYIEDLEQNEHDLIVRRKKIYHGSPNPDINTPFRIAEDATTGAGMYCTSDINKAWGYARHRFNQANKNESPRVYEFELKDKRFIDLRRQDEVDRILPGFRNMLRKKLQSIADPAKNYLEVHSLVSILENMETKKITPGTLKYIAHSEPLLFTSYLQSEGYDGLICLEGGEGSIGMHDTWLVFDPRDAVLTQEFSMTEE